MRRRGIVVAAAGDNCRDCFYAYGDHDMVDTFRQAVRILHVDHPLAEAPALVGPAPATIARLADHGRLQQGAPARLVVFNARTLNEIVSPPACGPHRDRRRPAFQRPRAGLFRNVGGRRCAASLRSATPC